MMAQVSGLEVGEFVHIIADAQIYDRHVHWLPTIERTPFPSPRLIINPDVTTFMTQGEDFVLEVYQSGRRKRISFCV
jgi:thymidylate synthase